MMIILKKKIQCLNSVFIASKLVSSALECNWRSLEYTDSSSIRLILSVQ